MTKKVLLRRIEELERRVQFLEQCQIARDMERIHQPNGIIIEPFPKPPYEITCTTSVS